MKNRKGKIQLMLGVLAIWLTVGFIVPYVNQSSTNEVMLFINQEEIDASVLFYTESEKGLEAIQEINLED